MVFKQIPKGYLRTEFPLPHNFQQQISLEIEDTSQNATYIPLVLNDEGLVSPDLVIANPEHGSFAEASTPYCYKNSIIPRMNIGITAKLTKGFIETDKGRHIMFNWMPVYTSFLNRLDAEDSKTAVSVEDILELEHETTGKSAYPIYNGTKLDGTTTAINIHANATVALMGMTTNGKPEKVAFDKGLFFDALQYYTNAPMLKKVIGRMHRVDLFRDMVYRYTSNNFTSPIIKRINPYTFCGILFYAPSVANIEQVGEVGDTTAINHIHATVTCRYDEWNSEFDQTSA